MREGLAATATRVRCQARGCRRMRRPGRRLCDPCWTRLPADLRREIWRLADRGEDLDAAGSRRLSELLMRAVRIAEEGIGA